MSLQADNTGAFAPTEGASEGRDEAFRRAQRHSRRVSMLKWALPTIGGAIAVGFAVYAYVITPLKVDIDVSGAALSDGRLVMASPKLEGFTKENRPYSMVAERAFQELTDTGVIELEKLSASLPFTNDATATVTAAQGFYDRAANTLELKGALNIKTTDGMSARLESAMVDIGKGTVTTDQPVDIRLKGGQVQAETMKVLERGKRLVFDKRVRMVLEPAPIENPPKASGS